MKTIITPGRLYSTLSREFRQACCAKCARCVLPLPQPVDDPGAGPTWTLGPLPTECDECVAAIAEIVRRNQEQFHLLDPVSLPVRAARPMHARDLGPLH